VVDPDDESDENGTGLPQPAQRLYHSWLIPSVVSSSLILQALLGNQVLRSAFSISSNYYCNQRTNVRHQWIALARMAAEHDVRSCRIRGAEMPISAEAWSRRCRQSARHVQMHESDE
jgi:hypothetical protein